ncbi:ABC transporter permease [Agathobaculum desmolans]|uniref:ABC transporter permease n=1 Tax=Agathobaculum desmolans TaxID=39484 RepID=UPI00248D478A|nr:ABC transporter permease [Agathobaculum desmolans]
MNWLQTVRMAFKSIMNNKVRSILTMLGIIIGVASVIAIVAYIQGGTKLQQLQFEAMGTNRIDISGYGAKSRDWDDFEDYLSNDLADKVSAWSPQSQYYDWQNDGIQYRSKKLTSSDSYTYMYFGNEHYGDVTNHVITVGRDLSAADCRSRARVCVIGETLRKCFFGAMSPLGQKIRIGGKSFEVVGVYKGKFEGKINTEDQMLVMPYTLQDSMMSSYGMMDKQYIIKAANKEDISELVDTLLPEFMQGRCESNGGYFNAYSNSQWQEQSEASANMLALIGGGVAGISLLVGGIGIMNIMLVSVTERTREIGIRMAIGARKRDIIGQFLVEAAVVSCFGGLIGIVLGCFLSAILGNVLLAQQMQGGFMPTVEQFTVLPSFGLAVGAFLFSALLGIIFGLYPANKASNLQPVDALRTQ